MMKFGKIYTFENKDEAKELIGKFVAYSNNYANIFNFNDERHDMGMLTEIEETGDYPFVVAKKNVQFIREVIEEKTLMTERQLAEWLASGFGEQMYEGENLSSHNRYYDLRFENSSVSDNVLIRPWGSDEWVEPTVDIYERDCKEKQPWE